MKVLIFFTLCLLAGFSTGCLSEKTSHYEIIFDGRTLKTTLDNGGQLPTVIHRLLPGGRATLSYVVNETEGFFSTCTIEPNLDLYCPLDPDAGDHTLFRIKLSHDKRSETFYSPYMTSHWLKEETCDKDTIANEFFEYRWFDHAENPYLRISGRLRVCDFKHRRMETSLILKQVSGRLPFRSPFQCRVTFTDSPTPSIGEAPDGSVVPGDKGRDRFFECKLYEATHGDKIKVLAAFNCPSEPNQKACNAEQIESQEIVIGSYIPAEFVPEVFTEEVQVVSETPAPTPVPVVAENPDSVGGALPISDGEEDEVEAGGGVAAPVDAPSDDGDDVESQAPVDSDSSQEGESGEGVYLQGPQDGAIFDPNAGLLDPSSDDNEKPAGGKGEKSFFGCSVFSSDDLDSRIEFMFLLGLVGLIVLQQKRPEQK